MSTSPEQAYLEKWRVEVDGFVRRHFTWPGTLQLHRAALGWDVMRAPVNVLLAPVLVLTLIAAWVARRLGLPRAAGWLARRRLLLPTAVSQKVEMLIATDLLGVEVAVTRGASDRAPLARSILAAPQLRDFFRRCGGVDQAEASASRIARAVQDYAGTRAAVAEMTAGIFMLAVGAIAFQAVTPGIISIAPGVAEAVSRSTAVADFPLGRTLGGMWYGVFPTHASPALVIAAVAFMAMLGAIVAAFAGVLADPVQARLGIHRRRLLRLIDTLETELAGSGEKPFTAREHFYARGLDIWDAVVSVIRVFRS